MPPARTDKPTKCGAPGTGAKKLCSCTAHCGGKMIPRSTWYTHAKFRAKTVLLTVAEAFGYTGAPKEGSQVASGSAVLASATGAGLACGSGSGSGSRSSSESRTHASEVDALRGGRDNDGIAGQEIPDGQHAMVCPFTHSLPACALILLFHPQEIDQRVANGRSPEPDPGGDVPTGKTIRVLCVAWASRKQRTGTKSSMEAADEYMAA